MALLVFYIRAKGTEHSQNVRPESGTAKIFVIDMAPCQGHIRAKRREHSQNGTPDSGTAKSFVVDMPPLQGLIIHEGPFLYQLSPLIFQPSHVLILVIVAETLMTI
jgi:hypothetical protein